MQQPTLEQVINWTTEAGEIAKKMQSQDIEKHYKAPTELVTAADTAVEEFLLKKIREQFPNHSINAEESGELVQDSDHEWFIDPIDGTLNFSHGLPIYSVSVAYAYRGELQIGVIFSPGLQETFWALKGEGAFLDGKHIQVSAIDNLSDSLFITGFRKYLLDTPRSNIKNFVCFSREVQTIRRLGSSALDMAYVACGRAEGFWEIALNPWDVAAGILIIREAGGIVEGLYGKADILKGNVDILGANPKIFPQMREILLEIKPEISE